MQTIRVVLTAILLGLFGLAVPARAQNADDQAAIKQTALDYLEGFMNATRSEWSVRCILT